jgi:hypothetical protein
MSTLQPRGSQGSTQRITSRWSFRRNWRRLQKYSEACSTRLRKSRGLIRTGATGLRTWHRIF